MPLHACAICYQASLYTHFHHIHSTNIHMQTLAQTLTYRHTHKHTHTNTYTHSNLALMLAGQSATSALACGVCLRHLCSHTTHIHMQRFTQTLTSRHTHEHSHKHIRTQQLSIDACRSIRNVSACMRCLFETSV
mgnify:CR=1 FL=1